jgi:hypothetical protein
MSRRAGPSAKARLLSILLGFALFGAAGAMTHAGPGEPQSQAGSPAEPRLVWDWQRGHAEARPRADRMEVARAVQRQRLGTGSWICSPAGSGMTSQCIAR